MAENINFPVAAGFYAIYTIGIVVFAVSPALKTQVWQHAKMFGALFGFFAYATYDLTNIATLRNWRVMMSVVDIVWRIILTSTSNTLGYLITRAIVTN